MRVILCFGDSNTWGAIPGQVNPKTGIPHRYPKNQRWTGVMQADLGDNYEVIEEGLNGRTTALDCPKHPYRNGLITLPLILETHYPIDLVILNLGTNDTKKHFDCSPLEIAENIRQLTHLVKKNNKISNILSTQVLIIAPQPVLKLTEYFPSFDQNSLTKTQELAERYESIAFEERCAFFNAGRKIISSSIDGIHLDISAGMILGKAVAQQVRALEQNRGGL